MQYRYPGRQRESASRLPTIQISRWVVDGPLSSSSITSTLNVDRSISLIVRSQLILMPSSSASSGFEIVGGHAAAVAPVNDYCFVGAQPLGGARGIHGRVTATVYRNPAADLRCVTLVGATPGKLTASRIFPASRVGMSIFLLMCAPTAMNTASKPPSSFSLSTSSTR